MEKREEKNGGENPNNTNGDHTHNTSLLGNNESDERGVNVQAKENGTADVTNGKTDDNQNKKDTSQESPGQSDNNSAPDAAEHDTVPPEVPVKTDTSKSKQEPSPGSSSNEPMQRLQVTEHDNGASQFEGDEGPEEAAVTQLLATLYYTTSPEGQGTDPEMPIETSRAMSSENVITILPTPDSPGQALKLKADGSVPWTTQGELSEKVQSAETRAQQKSDSLKEKAEEGPGTTSDMPGKTSKTMSSKNGSTTQLTTNSSVEALKLKASEKVKKSNDETQAATDTSITKSEKAGNTNASKSEGTGSSSEVKKSNDETPAATDTSVITSERTGNTDASRSEVNEPMKGPPATEDDNGASQPEGGEEFHDAVDITSDKIDVSSKNAITVQPNNLGDNRASPPENKQSGSENLQSESGSSHAGHAGEKDAEETEAQKRDANGRSEEEMKTGSGANKDDDKEGQPKKKKAKGEGMEGEGGTTHAVKTEQHVIKERSVSISLCTSAYSFNVEGLVSYLKGLMKKHPELIKEVKIHELPYNDLDHYKFDEKDPVDVMILCHSINNRRFAITNVMDALYDEYLPYCTRVIGKEKMGVIVHDFDDMREKVQSSRMSSFRYKQPKAFETTSLQITCGHIEKEEQVCKQMLQADREKIIEFLEHASQYPEEMQKEETKWTESFKHVKSFFSDIKTSLAGFGLSGREKEGQIQEPTALRSMGSNTQTAEPVQKNQDSSKDGTPVDPQPESSVEGNTEPDPPRDASPATQQSSGAVHATAASGTQGAVNLPSQQQMARNSEKGFTSAPQSSCPTPRRISVSVCSSAYQNNVQGLLSWFANFQAEHPHMINDVRFRSLPYNDIDSFRFPPNDPVDVMVLCHSVDNRGFSITDVTNALYEKYLKYCNKLIGKKKLAVIVHDFTDCKPATVKGRMESFESMQPLTFDLVETVIICSRLEDSAKLGIRDEDLTRLICFLELARSEPKENFKQSVFGKRF